MRAEFAEKYPKNCFQTLLELTAVKTRTSSAIIESFAYLAARIHLKLA